MAAGQLTMSSRVKGEMKIRSKLGGKPKLPHETAHAPAPQRSLRARFSRPFKPQPAYQPVQLPGVPCGGYFSLTAPYSREILR